MLGTDVLGWDVLDVLGLPSEDGRTRGGRWQRWEEPQCTRHHGPCGGVGLVLWRTQEATDVLSTESDMI